MGHDWQRFVRQPQTLRLRRALLLVHRWVGLALSLYVLALSLSGSLLVYRSELYARYQPRVGTVDEAVPFAYTATAWLLDLHDNLLFGETGRRWNAVGAVGVLLLLCTGAVVWWPGILNWRRGLVIDRRASWKRITWSLHSASGFWSLGFLLMWTISGFHLSYPRAFGAIADRLATSGGSDFVQGIGDRALYWLTYAHFGRFGGRVPGCGPACDATFKALWALLGLVPGLLAATGALIWWNRARPLSPARLGNREVERDDLVGSSTPVSLG